VTDKAIAFYFQPTLKNLEKKFEADKESRKAAKRSAMLYSLIGTCKLHGIESFAWLKIRSK
jgi:hypothetical protein